MSNQSDVLLVGQTPPPYHGQAVVTAMLFEYEWRDLKVERIRMSYSDTIDTVGKVALGKIIHLLQLILKTWWIVLCKRPRILYYLPASANRVPVIRDIIYLGCVRWLFPKVVFHYHAGGLPEYLAEAGIVGNIGRYVYSNADLSVEICKTDHSPGRLFEAKQIAYIANGLDVELVSRSRSEDGVLRALFLGALNEGKGVLDVIRAAKLARRQIDQLQVQLIGAWASDAFKKEAVEMVKAEGLEEVIHFPGPMKGKDKWQAYSDADIFIFPSHYQSENFPLVLIEAMAFGLPIISTTWRGIPQLVGNSGAAILSDINAPEQYAEALIKICESSDLRERMSQKARDHYFGYYTRDVFVNAMDRAFRGVLKI